MATVDFLPFAFDPAANVLDQADYLNVSASTWRQLGFSTGTALSPNLNKVWRQSSLISAMVAQFSSDATGSDMLDDGSTAGQSNLLATFTNAVRIIGSSGFTGNYLPLSGGTLTGPLVINAATALSINAPGGSDAAIALNALPGQATYLLGRSNNQNRWSVLFGDASVQGGSNQGANFGIARYSDAGALIDQPFSIARNTGIVNFTNTPTVAGGPMPFLPITGGILTGPMTAGGQGIRYAIAPEGPVNYVGFGWTGTACELMVNGALQGLLATQGYVGAQLTGYLPLTGGTITGNLGVTGNLIVNAVGGFGSTVYFAGLSDFANFQGGGVRYRQWAGNWYDYWNGQQGNRGWSVPGAGTMTLDYQGTLTVPYGLRSGGPAGLPGRVISISSSNGSAPSITLWGAAWGMAMGTWVDGSGMWFGTMDGNGNPTGAEARLQISGVFEVWNNVYFYSGLYVSGPIYMQGYQVLMTGNDGRVRYMGMSSGNSLMWTDADGSGWYANTYRSDPLFKDDIREADDFDSLGAIVALPIRSYRWKDNGEDVRNGFVSTDLRAVGLDDTVKSLPWKNGVNADHVEVLPMIAHLFRAVRQINARLETRP